MQEIDSLRQGNADLMARIHAVQDDAASSAYHSQQRIHRLENENFTLNQEIKQLQGHYKQAIKHEEVSGEGLEDLRRLAQAVLDKDAVIKKLTADTEDNKAHVYSLRAQLHCQKDSGVAVKQSMYNANEKLEKITKKYEGLKKRYDTQGRALKKLKSMQPSCKNETAPSTLNKRKSLPVIGKAWAHPDKPAMNSASHMSQGGYANPMRVTDDLDDEEAIPFSQKMEKNVTSMEAMDIDDMPLKQRVQVKKEKVGGGQSFGMVTKVKRAPEIIELDMD